MFSQNSFFPRSTSLADKINLKIPRNKITSNFFLHRIVSRLGSLLARTYETLASSCFRYENDLITTIILLGCLYESMRFIHQSRMNRMLQTVTPELFLQLQLLIGATIRNLSCCSYGSLTVNYNCIVRNIPDFAGSYLSKPS